MYKFFTPLLLCAIAFMADAQTKPATTAVNVQSAPASFTESQPYGKVDQADLELKSCDFEKDANAEVLFDKGTMTSDYFERHVRIKVFNDFGKSAGNIRLEFISIYDKKGIRNLQGETINLENGKAVITPLDSKVVYTETIDKLRSAVVSAMPNVKAGSIIEFKYRSVFGEAWYFQSNFPTKYSEIQTDFEGGLNEFKFISHVKQPYVKDVGKGTDTRQLKAMVNIHSLPDEPYMGGRLDNLQRIEYVGVINTIRTWPQMEELLLKFYNRDDNIDVHIAGERDILNQVKNLKTDDEKVAFIFNQVKNNMKWNDITSFFVDNGSGRVWDNKTGNSAEINWIVYHLLKRAGIKSYPLVIGSKRYVKINPAIPDLGRLANIVIYVPVDSTKTYVLDATNKYNLFNMIPKDCLNTFGLSLNDDSTQSKMVFMTNDAPVVQAAFCNVEIKPDGKMTGSTEITSYGYNKMKAIQRYKTDGEEKYINYLRNKDNSIKIASLKMENMEVDSLPLSQKIDFGIDLTGSDANYIYFNANLFNLMGENPFVSEERFSDIDFGYKNNFAISGVYKLPDGYKTDALPKSVTIVFPDQSITFKRIVVEDSGTLLIKYILSHNKTIYFREDYQDLRGFYKKMYELLNEQIVLKKA